MADKYASPYGTYTAVAGVIGVTAAAQVAALQAVLIACWNDTPIHPDFNKISPETRRLVNGEIAGVFAAIAAAPTA